MWVLGLVALFGVRPSHSMNDALSFDLANLYRPVGFKEHFGTSLLADILPDETPVCTGKVFTTNVYARDIHFIHFILDTSWFV